MGKAALKAAVGLAIGVVAIVSPANAAQPDCRVENLPPHPRSHDSNTHDDPLGTAIAEAQPGDILQVIGTCHGSVSITKDLTIQGRASANHSDTIDGDENGPVLITPAGAGDVHVVVRDLTVTGGVGGIWAYTGSLTVTNSLVTGNSSTGIGSFSRATVTIDHSIVADNHVAGGGGGIWNSIGGSMTIRDSIITGNSASSFGGGVVNRRTLTITNSVVTGNSAERGGGIYMISGSVALVSSTVSDNRASESGGGIFAAPFSTLTATDSSVSGNVASTSGGGILNNGAVTLDDSPVTGNTATIGGGVYNEVGGTVVLNGSSSVCGNTPDDWPGCLP